MCSVPFKIKKKPRSWLPCSVVLAHIRQTLLGFAVGHMLAHEWIIPTQLKTIGIVLAVFGGGIGMSALAALELDDNAIAFFAGHVILADYA